MWLKIHTLSTLVKENLTYVKKSTNIFYMTFVEDIFRSQLKVKKCMTENLALKSIVKNILPLCFQKFFF